MAQIEIKLTVDSDNANELQAVKVLLNVLGREDEAKPVAGVKKTAPEMLADAVKTDKKTAKEMMEEYEDEETPTEKAKRLKAEKDKARRDKKKAEETKEAESEEEEEAEEGEEESEEDEPEITLSSLQALLTKKVSDNKDAIKKKLEKLGAVRLTDLKKSKYEIMHEFLTDLD